MASYKIFGTEKLNDRVTFLVPINTMHCAHCAVKPGEEIEIESDFDIRAKHGTLALLEQKGLILVSDKAGEKKEAPKAIEQKAEPKAKEPENKPKPFEKHDKKKKGSESNK